MGLRCRDRVHQSERSRIARMFHENAPASTSPVVPLFERDGESERTTIKWYKYLTFRKFPAACCRELQLLSRECGDGCACPPSRACSLRRGGRATGQSSHGTAGLDSVPERFVAGSDTRGRPEGRPYPRSQSRRGVMKYPS